MCWLTYYQHMGRQLLCYNQHHFIGSPNSIVLASAMLIDLAVLALLLMGEKMVHLDFLLYPLHIDILNLKFAFALMHHFHLASLSQSPQ